MYNVSSDSIVVSKIDITDVLNKQIVERHISIGLLCNRGETALLANGESDCEAMLLCVLTVLSFDSIVRAPA
jgi:hypothetical protein